MAVEATRKSAVTMRGVRGTREDCFARSSRLPPAGTPMGRPKLRKNDMKRSRVRSMTPPRSQRNDCDGDSISLSSAWKARPQSLVSSGHKWTMSLAVEAENFCQSGVLLLVSVFGSLFTDHAPE